MSTSAICQNFVQNAWKKELCSNCFKSKDEHAERPKPKPIKLISNDNIEGIIKDSSKFKPKRSVAFTKELTEVIGYGGEDWEDLEDECDAENDTSSSEEDYIAESEDEEQEKELKRITRENTDFNANNLKSNDPVTAKKTVTTQLMLGKPLVDASGRKQTLLVSVTPFGEDSNAKKFIRNMSHIPISKNNKEKITDTKPNIVLTSYTKNVEQPVKDEEKSLLDEITETLENSKNPIQIMSRKKIQKEIILSVPRNDANNFKKIKNDENVESKSKISVERKVGLTRTPALKRDHEKPQIYQTSTAKIELSTNKIRAKINTDVKNDTTANSPKEQNDIDLVDNPSFAQSREQAGEPDGRADPDTVNEPPALPLTPPPPLEPENSFLHSNPSPIYEKPKVPSKPATVLIRKPQMHPQQLERKPVLSTFSNDARLAEEQKVLLTKQDSNGSDVAMRVAANKRKAPMPPENDSIYMRHSNKIDSPVVHDKEKRERASSCSPKVRNSISGNPQGEGDASSQLPEPAPRKTLSLSIDSLAVVGTDDKRKDKTKGRFSLKKFLRMGTANNKEASKPAPEPAKVEERVEGGTHPPLPKPRLIIVHPSELNGAKVEVVAKQNTDYQNITMTRYSSHELSNEYESYQVQQQKPQKPPPPPRNVHDDAATSRSKPSILPKSADIITKQKQFLNANGSMGNKTETVYANIGEVRSAIVPNKPQRTASMREREAQQQQRSKANDGGTYETVDGGENVYDYINTERCSSPESDSSRNNKNSPISKTTRLNKRCESSIDVSGEYFKFTNIPRSVSLTYCGSETESEIYSPYSFYGSESEITEDDHDWIQNGRTHKLRSRKGRSIVHKNLEDNYGAVIVANHEALAQVLENIQQTCYIQPALRGLKLSPNLRWADFSIINPTSPLTIGTRTFHQALWNNQHVTLLINVGAIPSSSTLSLGSLNLTPITEFSDLIPVSNFVVNNDEKDRFVQATVSVLPWLNVSTIQEYGEALKTKTSQNQFEINKDASFILLQLVNALKILQAQGIEEFSLSLNSFVLCKDMEKDTHHRLYVLQGFGEELKLKPDPKAYGTLCMCALKALNMLQPSAKITPLLQSLLNNERAVSLTQVKSILEFCLWGPSDIALGSTIRERELVLQRWLDLQRATVLHGLVCTRVQLTVYEECHLCFLVRSNSRMMSDASLLLESSNMKHILSNRS